MRLVVGMGDGEELEHGEGVVAAGSPKKLLGHLRNLDFLLR